jgi:hypothetical protein
MLSERSLVIRLNAQRSYQRIGKGSLQMVTTLTLASMASRCCTYFDCRKSLQDYGSNFGMAMNLT